MGHPVSGILAVIPGPGLLFGLLLVAAIIGGHLARMVRVPRVVGFLAGGAVLHVALYALVGRIDPEAGAAALDRAAVPLRSIRDLALGLILFTIGSMFERSKLRAVAGRVFKISLLEVSGVLVAVFLVCLVVFGLTNRGAGASDTVVMALLLAVAAVATAPAATLFVLREYEAKGPVTDTILGLTALNNIVCIVLFQCLFLTLAALEVIATKGSVAAYLGPAMLSSTLGSVALGVLVGTAIAAIHGRLPLSETLLFFFALFILLGAGEGWLWRHQGVSYNFLLTALVTGATFANVAVDAQKLESALKTFGSPIYAGFFVMAGYQLHLGELKTMGWLGAGYVLSRTLGKWLGCRLGIRWAGAPKRAGDRLGGALLCQAAVVIGLAGFVEAYWDHELATTFSSIVLGSVVVFEAAGPLLVKRCAVQAGEVKAITLLTRSTEGDERDSTLRRTVRALLRTVGLGGRSADAGPKTLRVEHIMRSNIQFIPASATFDEVLHAIERSTHSHFPVVQEDGELAGVIHFNDVHDVIYDPTLSDLVTAVDMADADSVAVPRDMALGELLDLFTEQHVAVLPVVDQRGSRRVVGLVEQRDLLAALHDVKPAE